MFLFINKEKKLWNPKSHGVKFILIFWRRNACLFIVMACFVCLLEFALIYIYFLQTSHFSKIIVSISKFMDKPNITQYFISTNNNNKKRVNRICTFQGVYNAKNVNKGSKVGGIIWKLKARAILSALMSPYAKINLI